MARLLRGLVARGLTGVQLVVSDAHAGLVEAVGRRCRQVQPVVTTKMIAASTSRSPYRRRPPPCGRVGAGSTTRWNSSRNSSGTTCSTITTRATRPPGRVSGGAAGPSIQGEEFH